MKNYNSILLCLFINIASNSVGINQAHEEQGYLAIVPSDIKAQIVLLLTSASSMQEAIKNIKALLLTNKAFAKFLDDQLLNKYIAVELSNKFLHNHFTWLSVPANLTDREKITHELNLVEAALKLNTPGAKKWVKDYIQDKPYLEYYAHKHIALAFDLLILSVKEGNIDWVKRILDLGAIHKINEKNYVSGPLENAILFHRNDMFKRHELIDILLQAGINPNVPHGMPLLRAIALGDKVLVQRLLDAGATLDLATVEGIKVHRGALMCYYKVKNSDSRNTMIGKNIIDIVEEILVDRGANFIKYLQEGDQYLEQAGISFDVLEQLEFPPLKKRKLEHKQ